jgi:DNA polymerase-3 subunit beta
LKLSLTQENLSRALGAVGRIVSSRSSLPILSNILLSTDGSRLKLTATNLEIGINYWLGSKVEEEGSVTIPARLFTDFVSSLPDGNLEITGTDTAITVKADHYEAHINGIAADEFPLIPEVKSKPALIISAAEFRDALQQVVLAASADESRPVLAGVYLYIEEQNLVIVATDSYRLAERKLKLSGTPGVLSVIVPAKTMQELGRILADADGDLSILVADSQVMFKVGDVELTSRLIEGQFPPYRQIIPTKIETAIEINVAEFARITKVASLFARENAGGIRLEIKKGGELSITSNASQLGENTSTAECVTKGDDGEVSLNARYLSEALAAIKTEEVELTASGKLNACVLRPITKSKTSDYLHIIMPLRT